MRFLFVFAALLAAPPMLSAQDTSAVKPVSAAAFTEEQAERGNAVFSRACVECHTRKDMSSADFRMNWNGRTVFELFDRIRTTMPDAAPGSMTREEYSDVTAYFLKLNGMPSGSMPLGSSAPSATPLDADSTMQTVKIDIPPTPPPPSHLVMRLRVLQTIFSSRGY